MRRYWSTRGLLIIAIGVLLFGAGTLTATALVNTPDASPPVLKVLPETGFRVGGQLQTTTWVGDNEYTDVPIHLAWTATDSGPEGVCRLSADRVTTWSGYQSPTPVYDAYGDDFPASGSATVDDVLSDYDGSYGSGGGWPDAFRVGADDCEYNGISRLGWRASPFVYQEDGTSHTDESSLSPTYTGTWVRAACSCASGGAQKWTSQGNAAVTFNRTFRWPDAHLGLVMAQGPGRGKATVQIDGVTVGTVNTYLASGNKNRIVVFNSKPLGAGPHTIKVINQATAGHPRIDVDAVLAGN